MSIRVKDADGTIQTVQTLDDLGIIVGAVTPNPPSNTVQDRLKALATLLTAGNATLASLLTGPINALGVAGEAHLGSVGGTIVSVEAAFTRPANTTAYASGQVIAQSTTAGSCVALSIGAARISGGTGKIHRVRVKTNDTGFAGKTVRVHLHRDSAPTFTNGDGGTWLTSENGWLGAFDVILDKHFSDPLEKGVGAPLIGNFVTFTTNASVNLYATVECRSIATPISGSAWVVALEVEQN